ncbi:hypothetical protein IV203_022492 [Nitzschia inconspicua]|uniref:Uncharacterized protein n=1 Tax=Nitzschia inconspicua TaxID=303405 RepID=A0A9K3KK32_9STRA|nr:hypothetical protein IV203_022726 [Nitzschia inconspicua]KAG7344484.1 hypothetical protein IV203_022492 [Nitzschia inconspicua]
MVVQVTSAKIAAAASKAMARRAGRGRSASALHATQFGRNLDRSSITSPATPLKTLQTQSLQRPVIEKLQSQAGNIYHHQSVIQYGSVSGAVAIDEYLGSMQQNLNNINNLSKISSAASKEGEPLDSKKIANMLMLRKELLLLHQLLDTLY